MANYQHSNAGLGDLIDRILDKGLVINADITISLAGTEILGIKLRAALASFETAAKFGLAFPTGTNFNAPAWKELGYETGTCPSCGNQVFTKNENICFCSSCGWKKAVIKQKDMKMEVVQDGSYNSKRRNYSYKRNLEKT